MTSCNLRGFAHTVVVQQQIIITWLCISLMPLSNIFLAASRSSSGRSVGLLVHKSSPLFCDCSFHPRRLKFGMEVKSVCLYEGVCLCSYQMAKRGQSSGGAYCKKVHNCQMNSQTCIKFSVK